MLRVLIFVYSCAAFAQVAPTGVLTGEVRDATGGAVANAAAFVINIGTEARREAITNTTGRFFFPLLPVGTYRIRVTAAGFSAFEQTGIRIDVDNTATLPVVLQVGSMAEQITVTGDASMVATESGTLSQVVRERYIQDL